MSTLISYYLHGRYFRNFFFVWVLKAFLNRNSKPKLEVQDISKSSNASAAAAMLTAAVTAPNEFTDFNFAAKMKMCLV